MRYRFTLKADQGKHRIVIVANCLKAALDKIMASQQCPENAIKKIELMED